MIEMMETEPKHIVIPVRVKSREDLEKIRGKCDLLETIIQQAISLCDEIAYEMAVFGMDDIEVRAEEKTDHDWEEDYFGPVGYVEEKTKALFHKKVENYEKR